MRSDDRKILEQSHRLSKQHVHDAVSPLDVVSVLNDGKVHFVLIGGHMLGFHTGTPRATVDVDVIVAHADIAAASGALSQAFPNLAKSDLGANVRFASADTSIDRERIDVVKASNAFFKRVLEVYTLEILAGGHALKVPTIEAAIALKFAAAISPNRGDESKPQDRVDLLQLIRQHPELDNAVIQELGDLVYVGGGAELIAFVTSIREGRRPVL